MAKGFGTKKDSCIFCDALITNFTRHKMIRKHSDEMQVAAVLAKPRGSSKRRVMFDTLWKQGNVNYNKNCMREIRNDNYCTKANSNV